MNQFFAISQHLGLGGGGAPPSLKASAGKRHTYIIWESNWARTRYLVSRNL